MLKYIISSFIFFITCLITLNELETKHFITVEVTDKSFEESISNDEYCFFIHYLDENKSLNKSLISYQDFNRLKIGDSFKFNEYIYKDPNIEIYRNIFLVLTFISFNLTITFITIRFF